jgi:hypothetical protein
MNLVEEHGCKKIALMKWHPDNPKRGFGTCAYCLKYPCHRCPLKGDICGNGSTWSKWCDADDIGDTKKADELADQMFHAIMKIDER